MKGSAVIVCIAVFLFFLLGIGRSREVIASHEQRLSVGIEELKQKIDGQTVRGSGTVTIDPPNIICSKTIKKNCKQRYATGTVVSLQANPDLGSLFVKWRGKNCADGPAAKSVTLNKSTSCKAFFGSDVTTTTTTTTATTTTTTTTTTSTTTTTLSGNIPPPNFKVAFIGDQGLRASSSKKVLKLIKNEGAQVVLHSGDFDYQDNPNAWEEQINSILGANFPYFAVIGNHEVGKWSGQSGYQQKLIDRINRLNSAGVRCTGDIGLASSCTFKGIFFVLSGVGTKSPSAWGSLSESKDLERHTDYLRTQLAENNFLWSICSWHKPIEGLQVGEMGGLPGYAPYEACREGGAIIATAHHHAYERTKTLVDMKNQKIDPTWPNPNNVRVTERASFVFVSGLGGYNAMKQYRCFSGCPEWASIYTETQNAQFGALFCSFHVNGKPHQAHCYFKTIDGDIPDQFDVTRTPGP